MPLLGESSVRGPIHFHLFVAHCSIEFLAADGEQFSMLYVEAVLKNKCGNEYTIVKKTRYDNYVVDKNVTLHHDIKKGTYGELWFQ